MRWIIQMILKTDLADTNTFRTFIGLVMASSVFQFFISDITRRTVGSYFCKGTKCNQNEIMSRHGVFERAMIIGINWILTGVFR